MKYYYGLIFLLALLACDAKKENPVPEITTFFEENGGKEAPAYHDVINFYMNLAREFPTVNIQTIGNTDSGLPLHLVTFNADGDFNFQRIREEKLILLINNGIHPGEPDGMDASMLLFRDLSSGKMKAPEDLVIATIPVYNIGGALNRNQTSRVNQNGPGTYGFRGNTRNYDLNRDFIKADTQNARTFAEIFHLLDPHLFIDTHVSNGADYQYVLTHLFTQHNKLGGKLGALLEEKLKPQFEKGLENAGWDISPFVNVYNRPPDSGFPQFMDHPRYSTGYAALWQTIGLMIETHMLKPYQLRVAGTLASLKQFIEVAQSNSKEILESRQHDRDLYKSAKVYPMNWEVDSAKVSTLAFKGYKADTIISSVTGLPRLKYNRDSLKTIAVPYLNTYRPKDSVAIPPAYIIKKGWTGVIDNLLRNGIAIRELDRDTTLEVTVYRIGDYSTYTRAYEGHYPHYNTTVQTAVKQLQFSAGDYYVPTAQEGNRFIVETLEPMAVDSYFNWNFFDPILQQKEGFSPYVFEDLAAEILEGDKALQAEFIRKKEANEDFRNNATAQLDWIYENSVYYEAAHLHYPVYKLMAGYDVE